MNVMFRSEFFPFYARKSLDSRVFYANPKRDSRSNPKHESHKNRALLSLGANLPNKSANLPIRTLNFLFLKLRKNPKIRLISTSPIFQNPPFGFTRQRDFFNATMWLKTSLCLSEFYALMFYLERIFGRNRKRAFKNAPRTLDIDLIAFNNLRLKSARLNLPHAAWDARISVLAPLCYQFLKANDGK